MQQSTSFKQFLLTESRSEPIDQKQAIEWARQNSFQYITNVRQTGAAIYRGLLEYDDSNFLFGDPSKHSPRVSANTTNEYTLLLDNLPNWKQFPKRSQSFICSTCKITANNFGKPFFMCPMNNALIGIAPKSDLWNSFDYLTKQIKVEDLDEFNQILGELLSKFISTKEVITYTQLHDELQQFKQMMQSREADVKYFMDRMDIPKDLIKQFAKHDYDPLKAITELLDPQTNNFDLQKASNFNVTGKHEVWFSSPTLLVELNYGAEQFIEQVLD